MMTYRISILALTVVLCLTTFLAIDASRVAAQEGWGPDVFLAYSNWYASSLNNAQNVAVNGSTVHVVWYDSSYKILYKRSIDNGATWEDTQCISGNLTESQNPSVALSRAVALRIASL
jgi:hypothetical protein